MKVFLRREGSRLAPAGADDEEKIRGLRGENWYKADLRKVRNPGHHRKAFALIKLMFDSQERYETIDDLLVELKVRTGWYHEHILPSGQLVYVPKSIAFENMDQIEFEAFYEKLVNVAVTQYGLEHAIDFAGDVVTY